MRVNNQSPVVTYVPLCGEYVLEYYQPRLVETGPVANQSSWDDLYVARGCKTPRDKRRLDYSLARAYNVLRVSDVHVVNLLGTLAGSALKTPFSLFVLEQVRLFKEAVGNKTYLEAGTPAWEILRGILNTKVDPTAYGPDDITKYMSDISISKLLAKYPFEGADEIANKTAIDKLLNQEKVNKLTNRLWSRLNPASPLGVLAEKVSIILADILGPPPTPEQVLESAAWGPGTTVGYPFGSSETGPEMKFGASQTCTPNLTHIAPLVIKSIPGWSHSMETIGQVQPWLSVVPGDVLETVKKKFEEARCIMIQPSINIWLTRGLGVWVRKNLLTRAGVDLLQQQFRNRELARIGSATGLIATLDLTSASDSTVRQMLRSVLHPGWYAWFHSTVSEQFQISGLLPDGTPCTQNHKYEMISAMGCGFTFELLTAVCTAICRAVVPGVYVVSERYRDHKSYAPKSDFNHKLSQDDLMAEPGKAALVRRVRLSYPHIGVNGDDIAVPTAYAPKVMEALKLFGYSVNEGKSYYSSGPGFRESCGADYLYGVAVRPLYLTTRLENGLAISTFANRIVEHSQKISHDLAGDSRWGCGWFRGLHRQMVGFIPPVFRSLIAVPRLSGSAGGLWELADRYTFPETLGGQPTRYRVFLNEQCKVRLRECAFELNGIRWQCCGGNLLAARLHDSELDPDDAYRWQKVPRGAGEYSVVRDDATTKIGFVSCTGHSRWLGWRNLT